MIFIKKSLPGHTFEWVAADCEWRVCRSPIVKNNCGGCIIVQQLAILIGAHLDNALAREAIIRTI